MSEFKPFTIEKPWGDFRQFNLNTPVTVKIIAIKAGEAISLQSHAKRSEFWHIVSGGGVVEIGGNEYNAKENNEYNISCNTKHRAMAGLDGLVFLEVSTGDFDEEDIVRYEDKYGRAKK